ncbi:MAG: TIGR00282 family metallophosphoesterase [Candidatus Gracilibacteria bacterium]|nr:TIGR00282 family metallophosphoesterase [Candidatus Gracilibacteria bacterium]
MKLLIFGDVFGRVGREGLKRELPKLIEKYNPDFVIANVDNVSSGRGAIEKHILELERMGVDIMTSGDHIFDNFEKIKDYLARKDSRLLRCANFYEEDLAGKGFKVFEKNGKKLLVIHLQGEVFMNHKVTNPFLKAKEILELYKDENLDGIVLDFHNEASAEAYGLVNYLDGEISFMFGTHTHVQTNDDMILKKGTGFISDVGMNGPFYSVIGADFESVKPRFLSGINKGKIEQSLDDTYLVSGVYVEIGNDRKCEKIEKIRIIKK